MKKKKEKKENTEEFEKIIESLEKWKPHVRYKPGSQEVSNAGESFKRMQIEQIEYPSKKRQTEEKNKFGGRPRRRSTLRVPLAAFANDFAVSRPAKRRSYIKNKSQSAPSLRSGRRRSKRKTTVRYSRIRKYP